MAWADCWPLADPPLICSGGGGSASCLACRCRAGRNPDVDGGRWSTRDHRVLTLWFGGWTAYCGLAARQVADIQYSIGSDFPVIHRVRSPRRIFRAMALTLSSSGSLAGIRPIILPVRPV